MNASDESTPDICLIALDETDAWADALPAEFAHAIERIETVYYYDANRRVHVAEITPSYELWRWITRAVTKSDVNVDLEEQIDSYVIDGAAGDEWIIYAYTNTIDTLARERGENPEENDWTFSRLQLSADDLGEGDYEQRMDMLRDYLNDKYPL